MVLFFIYEFRETFTSDAVGYHFAVQQDTVTVKNDHLVFSKGIQISPGSNLNFNWQEYSLEESSLHHGTTKTLVRKRNLHETRGHWPIRRRYHPFQEIS